MVEPENEGTTCELPCELAKENTIIFFLFFGEGREQINELNKLYIPLVYLHFNIKNFKSVL